eukprot:TRINITY_DN37_c0_g1_i1.p1 TRINITY_DN37_c0_g1~~TRINITY_DN37_c0_g1_i1.p1  ORF type:complete len:352 (+),score=111.43 TRINITY_DN37_c0_g1_i1:152-1207(+)
MQNDIIQPRRSSRKRVATERLPDQYRSIHDSSWLAESLHEKPTVREVQRTGPPIKRKKTLKRLRGLRNIAIANEKRRVQSLQRKQHQLWLSKRRSQCEPRLEAFKHKNETALTDSDKRIIGFMSNRIMAQHIMDNDNELEAPEIVRIVAESCGFSEEAIAEEINCIIEAIKIDIPYPTAEDVAQYEEEIRKANEAKAHEAQIQQAKAEAEAKVQAEAQAQAQAQAQAEAQARAQQTENVHPMVDQITMPALPTSFPSTSDASFSTSDVSSIPPPQQVMLPSQQVVLPPPQQVILPPSQQVVIPSHQQIALSQQIAPHQAMQQSVSIPEARPPITPPNNMMVIPPLPMMPSI